MKCVSDELIQKYIDNEISQEEKAYVEEHLSGCAACSNAADEQRKLAAEICGVINLLSEEVIEIPAFNRQVKDRAANRDTKDKKRKNRVMIRWSAFAASAACILVFMIFMLKPEKETPVEPATFLNSTENEFDANRSISQQIGRAHV